MIAATFVVVSMSAFSTLVNWRVKPGATITFEGDRVKGSFDGLKAEIVFDKDHLETAKFSASIDVASISTGFFLKNTHAKSALGADDFRTIKFESTSVAKSGAGYVANGKLTLKGQTRAEFIHFTFEDKGNEGLFKGDLKVTPKSYGVTRSGTPPVVTIHVSVPVTKD